MKKIENNVNLLKLSKTPILHKSFRKVRKMNSKFLPLNDDFEKNTALIIEDEELQKNLIVRKLPSNFKWFWAKSVQESVKIYEDLQSKYITVDVLFLDLFLQDSKGTEFLKISKIKGWLEDTLIVVMTGSKEIEIIKECIDCLTNRFYKFYSKPVKDVEFERLSEEIKKHIDKISCPLKGYKIIKHVGAGAQADVYKVIGLKNRKIYAMKVNKDKNMNSKEVQVLKKINSPTIIHLYESQILNEKEYMILEFAERGTLYERIKKYSKENKKFDEIQILDWIIQVLIGLYSLHKHDIMHRDIKSDNLFLCENDVVKIGDLGQASNESKCKSFVGTFFYRAPEMQDFGEYKKEIDIWSAGVVLYELIMLCRPFEGIEQKEVQNRIEKIDYKPIPDETDYRLKKILHLTLTYKENRASAAQLLSFDFVKSRINYFHTNKIINFEKSFMEEILNLNYSIEETKLLKTVVKEYNFLKCFQNLQIIYFKFTKTTLYSNYYLNSTKVINHSNLFNKSIKDEDIKVKEKNNKYDADYYKIIKYKIDGIDNTLNFPINNNDFFDNFYLDDLETSFKALEKIKKAFIKFRHVLEDGDAKEEDKYICAYSEEVFDSLIEIKNFQNINLDKYKGEEKISMMLNIYQTMIYHYIMKCVVFDYNPEKNFIFSNLFSSLKLGKTNISLKYIIAGETYTIQDMKSLVFKIKSPPIFFLYQPNYKIDPRYKLLDEKYINKLSGICFKPNNLYKDLNSSLYHYISEKNIFPDENTVNMPKDIHEYIKQYGEKENEVIQTLIKFFFKDFSQKMYTLINKSKRNILRINYC